MSGDAGKRPCACCAGRPSRPRRRTPPQLGWALQPWAALSTSELLQEADQDLVDAVIDSLIEAPIEEIEEVSGAVEVIEVDSSEEN